MITIKGRTLSGGIKMGELFFLKQNLIKEKITVHDTEREYNRFLNALDKADAELEELFNTAQKSAGEQESEIFKIHRMMIGDPEFCGKIKEIIFSLEVNAEYAVSEAAKALSEKLKSTGDPYLSERVADVEDISRRIIAILSGAEKTTKNTPVVVAASELLPSDTVRLKRENILAFVTNIGSQNSHTSILARSMGIPAIVCREPLLNFNGKFCIVDGENGLLIIEPNSETTAKYYNTAEEINKKKERLRKDAFLPATTKDGKKIEVFANIGDISDADTALENGAEGVGLLRSEFLFLGRNSPPTEQEQFNFYKSVAEKFKNKPVIIRTIDIGADKIAEYFKIKSEVNPALGFRGIRMFLQKEDIALTQLRAILKASAFGNVKILLPLITSLGEVSEAKALINKAKQQLISKGEQFNMQIKVGVMLETPAACINAKELCSCCDFFSIGTNDLTQYTLATDRTNDMVAALCNPEHRAVLRLIYHAVETAKKNDKWIGVCGEVAANEKLAEFFIACGVNELSVSPTYLPKVKDNIRAFSCGNPQKFIEKGEVL